MKFVSFQVKFTSADGEQVRLIGDAFMFYVCSGHRRDGGGGCQFSFFSSVVVDRIPCPFCGHPIKGVIGTFATAFLEDPPSGPAPPASRSDETVDIHKPLTVEGLMDPEEEP